MVSNETIHKAFRIVFTVGLYPNYTLALELTKTQN